MFYVLLSEKEKQGTFNGCFLQEGHHKRTFISRCATNVRKKHPVSWDTWLAGRQLTVSVSNKFTFLECKALQMDSVVQPFRVMRFSKYDKQERKSHRAW